MAIESLIIGAIARLAPEVLAIIDKRGERKHELKMAEQNLKITQLQNEGKLAIVDREIEGKQFEAGVLALKAGIEAQGKPTGIRWIDALNASVRPVIAYWVFGLYSIAKLAQIEMARATGIGVSEAVQVSWTQFDGEMMSAVIMFFFVGRIWERGVMRSFK
jgi:hypothetical protein